MQNKKPILVTGSHRSGSTWVGRTIALEPTIGYVHEPFNPDANPHQVGRYSARFKYWFTYISSENEHICLKELEDTLAFRYKLSPVLQQLLSDKFNRDPIESLRILREYLLCLKNRSIQARPLIKDPIALFSAEWIAEKFGANIIVCIRHPAAFVGSLKVAKWKYPFSHLSNQKLLIEGLLSPFETEIQDLANHKSDLDEIEQAALLWKIMHYIILKYQENHPEWLFVRHEDISQDPLAKFKTIFEYLGLNYSESIQDKILHHTSARGNSQDVKTYSKKATRAMNSQENVKSWQKRLSKSEIIKIRKQVEDISDKFYVNSDWE